MKPVDLLGQLEHDHHHLDRLVEDVQSAVQATLRGERQPAEIRDEIAEFLKIADEEIYEHFDREEQALFPFVRELFPDAASRVRKLEFAHDRMCGILSRAQRINELDDAEFTEQFDSFIAIFARFEATYSRHSSEEISLIRDVSARVNDVDRARLVELLRSL